MDLMLKEKDPMPINPIHQLVIAIPLVELGLGYDSRAPMVWFLPFRLLLLGVQQIRVILRSHRDS
jgi:hypothetical protein